MINSPNNPSGKYYDSNLLKEISKVLLKKHENIYISSDDIYEHIQWVVKNFIIF